MFLCGKSVPFSKVGGAKEFHDFQDIVYHPKTYVDRLRDAPPFGSLRMEDVHIYPRAEIGGSRTILS